MTTDDLTDRIKQRQRQWRIRFAALGVVVALLISVAYLGVADAGFNVPAGAAVRVFLDRPDISVIRHAHSTAEIREAASSFRRDLLAALKTGQTREGGFAPSLKPGGEKTLWHWSNVQALAAMLTTPELSEAEAGQVRNAIEIPFAPGAAIEGTDGRKYGWVARPNEDRTQAEPAMWTAAALANALGSRAGFLAGDARSCLEKSLVHARSIENVPP